MPGPSTHQYVLVHFGIHIVMSNKKETNIKYVFKKKEWRWGGRRGEGERRRIHIKNGKLK